MIDTDYFVTGTGASAMTFVDTLLTELPDAGVVMVDRHHRPGGHWNDAYPYVRLHQPSAWYGVPSRELSDWTREATGFNQGMWGLASGAEVLAHFEQAMKQRFLPSGRVQWFPKCEHVASEGRVHRMRSLLTGEEQLVQARKWVDATHARTEVPVTHPPKYRIAPGVRCIPCNDLPRVSRPYARYTVVGSGKTGMDALLWLVENGVPHARIRWIMPRDAWMLDRANMQPGPEGWRRFFAGFVLAQFDAICEAADPPDLFRRLEACGALMRIDPAVEPAVFHAAIVSRGELAQLRQAGEIVRLGRVRAIEPARIVLERGDVPAEPDTLYVDCSASALQPLPGLPVFDGDTIHLLMVRQYQPLFSSSVIAWVEAHVPDEQERNALCAPVPQLGPAINFLHMFQASLANAGRWRQNAALSAWLPTCRLNGQAVMLKGVDMGPEVREALERVGHRSGEARRHIARLLAMASGAQHAASAASPSPSA